jgi:hypothetical protein
MRIATYNVEWFDALLDYILVGPSFGKQANNWRI